MENVLNHAQKDIELLMASVKKSDVGLDIIGMKSGTSVRNVNQILTTNNANMLADMGLFWKIKNVFLFAQCPLKSIMKTNAFVWVECTELMENVTIARKVPDMITIVTHVNQFAPNFPTTISSIKDACVLMVIIGLRDAAKHVQLDTSTMKDGDNALNHVVNMNTSMELNAIVKMGITWLMASVAGVDIIKYTIQWPWYVDLDAKLTKSWKETSVCVNGTGWKLMAYVNPNVKNSNISME